MKKRISLIIIIIFTLSFLAACSDTKKSTKAGEISVVVSFNPLREFASAIGKDKIDLETIVPNGTEPHDFEPKARDLMNINDADIFIYNGLGMESWIDKVNNVVTNKRLIMVDASKGCNVIPNEKTSEVTRQYDPHIWLSLMESKKEALNIEAALVKADPKDKDFFVRNYNEFAGKLDNLYNEYRNKIGQLTNKDFVTGHAAFGYLCRDFGLKQNSVEDIFADGEPSAEGLKEIVDYCRTNNIRTIFSESMVSPKISETLANEVGAKVEKIYTLESSEDEKDYLTSMKDNLEKIYNSLKE